MAGVDARISNLMVAFSEAASALTPSSSNFSLKCTSESESIVVAIIVHARRRFNTAATSVTTIPLTVCYGALNLLVFMDTSNFVPYVCDRAIVGEHEGPESTVPSSAISGGSVAAERSYRTRRTLAPVIPVWVRLTLGPNVCFIFPSFYNRPDSHVHMPLCIIPSSIFRPPREKSARCCRFERLSDSGFTAHNMAFYRPSKARTDISLANKHIT